MLLSSMSLEIISNILEQFLENSVEFEYNTENKENDMYRLPPDPINIIKVINKYTNAE